jgi:predicted DNA-binding transcriptional regulator YafY
MGAIYKLVRFLGWVLFFISLIFIISMIVMFFTVDNSDRWAAFPVAIIFGLLALAGWKMKKIKKRKSAAGIAIPISNHQEEKKKNDEEDVKYHIEMPEEDKPDIADTALATASPKKRKAPAKPSPAQSKVKPIWEGKVYYLEYQAEDGSISERNIEINKIENGGRPRNSYIHAFCFQSLAMRTFRFDRIAGLYEDDGPEIENPFYYLTTKQNRPARVDAATLAAEALNDGFPSKGQ